MNYNELRSKSASELLWLSIERVQLNRLHFGLRAAISPRACFKHLQLVSDIVNKQKKKQNLVCKQLHLWETD